MPTLPVYRTSSLISAYFHFGAVQNRVLTNDTNTIGPPVRCPRSSSTSPPPCSLSASTERNRSGPCPRIYKSQTIADAIVQDFETAPIPDLHKTMFCWAEQFTSRSWDLTAADLDGLRSAGLDDTAIVDWAQVAALQTWWVMQADGGGIPLEGDTVTGVAVGHDRSWYHAADAGLTASTPAVAPIRGAAGNDLCWVETNEPGEWYQTAAEIARQRWGFVPNPYRAVSLQPDILPRHQLALELLESPQTDALSPRQHAIVRALTNAENRSPYLRETTRQQLLAAGGDQSLFDAVTGGYESAEWDRQDQTVLDFAAKMARNA